MQIMAKSCLLAYERLQVTKDVVGSRSQWPEERLQVAKDVMKSQMQWPEGHFHRGWHFDSVKEGAHFLHQTLPHLCQGQAKWALPAGALPLQS